MSNESASMLSSGLNRDQAVTSLKLLIGKLPACRFLEEEMIILCCRLVLAQVVISSSPQEIANRKFREKFGPGIQHLDDKVIILGFIRPRPLILRRRHPGPV